MTRESYQACMALRVGEAQRRFVAPNIVSLVQAAYEPDMFPMTINLDGEIVGFLLYDFDPDLNGWSMSRFMIDEKHQKRGIGGEALERFLAWFHENHPEADKIYTSAEVDNPVALKLYEKHGFKRGEAFEYDVDDMHLKEYRLCLTWEGS